MLPGPRNLITDVAGLSVGNAEDHRLKSGVTAIVCDPPATAAVQVLGGAPGTRETDLLEPHNTVQTVDGIILSGGSAFGLDAASGAQAALREMGRGFAIGPHRVPIVPTAILFDLINGGDKDWGQFPPYRELGYEAVQKADADFATGSVGRRHRRLDRDLQGWPRLRLNRAAERHYRRRARGRQCFGFCDRRQTPGTSGPPLTRNRTSSAGSAFPIPMPAECIRGPHENGRKLVGRPPTPRSRSSPQMRC